MAVAETGSSLIAWWGAILSTVLAVVKLFELWRDRDRVGVSYNFTGNESIGNEILIRNLSSRPLILAHWELLYCSGRWPIRKFKSFESAEFDAGDRKLEPYATHALHFSCANYFSWGHKALNGRRIFIRLHIAGRKPLLELVYSQ
ncbi:hypothetical protein [Methylophaga sp.]|uniref:hypothetical protein n=1 Tax=Methylophaga sp. TaxID=2024840 RepID=UPI002726B6E2|nr:hypothetical protein [Methylophaga sp.]MDO8826611.1 hypothetical protein [Methylophaga sp.]